MLIPSILIFFTLWRIGDEVGDVLGKDSSIITAMGNNTVLQISPGRCIRYKLKDRLIITRDLQSLNPVKQIKSPVNIGSLYFSSRSWRLNFSAVIYD
jgi:hypothetical protein